MIGIGNTLLQTNGVFDNYLDWLLNILKFTGMTFSTIFLVIFIIWLTVNLVFSLLCDIIPFIRGVIRILEFLLLPGSIMHMVWHVFAAKKLNIQTEHIVNFGYGWSRAGIKLTGRITNLRQAIIFYWAPILNLPLIVGWVIPGMYLFQWLDTLIDKTVFYWIWLYILFSLVVYGLPDMADLVNPFQITIVKTPEFYLFVFFYVILAPITLILWGFGLTIIFSLIYAITTFYEVNRISKKEEKRLAKKFDKTFRTTESTETTTIPLYIITD